MVKGDRVPAVVRLEKELLNVSERRDCVALKIEFCDLVMTSTCIHSYMRGYQGIQILLFSI